MVIDVDLGSIRRRLAEHAARRHAGQTPTRWAAVATILRDGEDGAEVLLIRRAQRDGDPWSGHVAFPGGHREPADSDLLATAQRETQEEVGIDLRSHELLGALDQHPATAKGRFTGIVVAPYAFALRADANIVPNHEVAKALWVPLGPLVRGERDAVKVISYDGERMSLPAWSVGDDVVWGLTHRMLSGLFALLAPETLEP